MISIQFQYGVSDFDISTSILFTGTVTSSTSLAFVQTGTDPNGSSRIESKRDLRYKPGHEGWAFFTAFWPDGSEANATQYIGLFDDVDGAAIGYTGTSFSILFRRGSADTVVTQPNFNVDTIDGSGTSGFNIDTTKLNVFRITYGWLGAAPIKYYVLSSQGQWILFHIIEEPNTVAGPSFLNPILPIRAKVTKVSGSTTNRRLATASWDAGVESEQNVAGYRYFSSASAVVIAAITETYYITIRNRTTFHGKANKIEVRVAYAGGGSINTAAEASLLRLRTNATGITGYTNFDTNNSVIEVSTSGTFSGGTVIFVAPNNTGGSGPFFSFFPTQDFSIILLPGDSVTLTIQSLSGGGNDAIATIGWEERF